MTKTTDSRQLGMIFRGVLEKHGLRDFAIANGKDLMAEMDLVMAAKMYFAEVKQIGATNVREKIFETLKLAEAKVEATDAMEGRITAAIGITAHGKLWDDVLAFLIREDKQGRTIELFAKACEDDKFNMPKAHQIGMSPSLIMTMWKRAFSDKPSNLQSDRRPEANHL